MEGPVMFRLAEESDERTFCEINRIKITCLVMLPLNPISPFFLVLPSSLSELLLRVTMFNIIVEVSL
jgi:hypothetical protein